MMRTIFSRLVSDRAVRRLYSVAPVNFGRRLRAVGPKRKAAAARNRILCTGLSTETAKSQSLTHMIINMLKFFMHFNANRSFSHFNPTPFTMRLAPTYNISQY